MQFPQPNTLGNIEPEGGAAGSQVPTQPASMYPRDFSSPDRDEFLSLLIQTVIASAPWGSSQAHW